MNEFVIMFLLEKYKFAKRRGRSWASEIIMMLCIHLQKRWNYLDKKNKACIL